MGVKNSCFLHKVIIFLLLLLLKTSSGMVVNLNLPYKKEPSPPAKPYIFFYSKDSDNLIFRGKKNIKINCKCGYRAISLDWALSKNLIKKPFLQGKGKPYFANTFLIDIPAEKLKPGFYDLKVYIDVGEEKKIEGICTFGYEIEKINYFLTREKDFEKFWKNALSEINKIPLNPEEIFIKKMTDEEIDEYNTKYACLPPRYDPEGIKYNEVEVYKVSFQSLDNLRVYGYLSKPVGKGPFPGMLILPGAGYRSEPMPVEHARHGFVALDIQVHNQDVDLPKYEVPQWEKGKPDFNNPKTNKFYRMYLNCLQAINYLCSREDVDKNKIVAVGGSQGGRLSIILAALDNRIKAIVSAIPHGANLPYIKFVNYANSKNIDGINENFLNFFENKKSTKDKFNSYFDPANFAPMVKCPVLMNTGLIDPVSPPSCTYAIYKFLKTKDKEIIFLPGLAHDWSAEFDRYAWKFLKKVLKDTKK